MLRKVIVGALLALTAAGGALVATPAQANPRISPDQAAGPAADRYVNLDEDDLCPQGYFCAFEQLNLIGRGVGFFATELNWGTIPTQFRWINNRARSGVNNGFDGSLPDVIAYPLPNHQNDPRWPAVCLGNFPSPPNRDWGALRPESNKWVSNRC